jgi:hypothetical protein
VARWLGEQGQDTISSIDKVVQFSFKQFTDFLQLQVDEKLANQQAKTVMKAMLAS